MSETYGARESEEMVWHPGNERKREGLFSFLADSFRN